MLHHSILTVYIGSNHIRKTMIHEKGEWTSILHDKSFQKGQTVRLGIQFQGICFVRDVHSGNLKYRLQHSTRAIYAVT